MPLPRPAVLILDPLPEDVETELGRHFDLFRAGDGDLDLLAERHGAAITAMTCRGKTDVDDALMARFANLRIVSAYGVGYDRVDAAAAARRGIMVTNTPDVLDADVADLAVSLLLATIRRIPQADRFVREGRWPSGPFPLTATLRGRRVGLVGMGRIGQEIARRLAAFDVALAYHSRRPVPAVPYPHFPDLHTMARDVDTMIVIVPGGPATRHLIDAAILSALGANGVLVNVSRGSVVDETALTEALAEGAILAAGLDVYEHEPSVSPRLRQMENVVLLPHIGSGTHHTRSAMGRLVVGNLLNWFEKGTALTPVRECRRGDPEE